MFKKSKLLILPTKEITQIQLGVNFFSNISYFRGQYFHLYILSNEEIKEGDWYYQIGQRVIKCGIEDVIFSSHDKKIIASTDLSLELPILSDPFIKRYCELGGIDEVMVEYEEIETLPNKRKADQHWEMAGLARMDGDMKDSNRHTELARVYDKGKYEVKLKLSSANTIIIKAVKTVGTKKK